MTSSPRQGKPEAIVQGKICEKLCEELAEYLDGYPTPKAYPGESSPAREGEPA